MPATSADFFGLVWLNRLNKPNIPLGTMRLWDTGTPWYVLNPSSGNFVWTALDNRLTQAAQMGVNVLYTVGGTPNFISSNPSQPCASGAGNTGCAAPPSDLAAGNGTYKAFITALVQHSLASLKPIKYYNLWNEPDQASFWSGTIPQLVQMCSDAAQIIRSLDPKALIIGPSPTGNNPGNWLTQFYGAGGKPTMDAVSFHTFSTISGTLADLTSVRAVMAQNGDSAKPVYVTEGNWGTTQNSTLTDDQKVAFLGQEYLQLWAADVAQYDWYAWDSTTIGTLEIGGVTQPAGTAYGLLFNWLVGATRTGPLTQDANGTFSLPLTLASNATAVATWNAVNTIAVPTNFTKFLTLDNAATNPVIGGTVAVGTKPILLTSAETVAHTYTVVSCMGVGDNASIIGSVDGVAIQINMSVSAINQANAQGGLTAVHNLVSPNMLAAAQPPVPTPVAALPPGTWTQ